MLLQQVFELTRLPHGLFKPTLAVLLVPLQLLDFLLCLLQVLLSLLPLLPKLFSLVQKLLDLFLELALFDISCLKFFAFPINDVLDSASLLVKLAADTVQLLPQVAFDLPQVRQLLLDLSKLLLCDLLLSDRLLKL